nr:hypothetical protein [uncultured Clostridium sp.]
MAKRTSKTEKPMKMLSEECPYCLHWQGKKKGCSLESCPYFEDLGHAEDMELGLGLPETEEDTCSDCPYGRASPCIGFCIRKIMEELDLPK